MAEWLASQSLTFDHTHRRWVPLLAIFGWLSSSWNTVQLPCHSLKSYFCSHNSPNYLWLKRGICVLFNWLALVPRHSHTNFRSLVQPYTRELQPRVLCYLELLSGEHPPLSVIGKGISDEPRQELVVSKQCSAFSWKDQFLSLVFAVMM